MLDTENIKLTLQKNTQTALKSLGDFRQEINNINDELHWVKNSPMPLSDVNLKIENFIKNNSKKEGIEHFFYEHRLEGLKPFEANVELSSAIRVHEDFLIGGKGTTDLENMMCSLFGSIIQSVLQDQAKEAAKEIKSGPPLSDRKQIKADLLAKKNKIEIKEESLICQAEELGLIGFYRRHDCNPDIVLMMNDE